MMNFLAKPPRLIPVARLAVAMVFAAMLGGCEKPPALPSLSGISLPFTPTDPGDPGPCPPIMVSDGYEDAMRVGERHGQRIRLRIAGTDPQCFLQREIDDDGGRVMRLEMFVDLLAVREPGENRSRGERVDFALTFAFVDDTGAVVSRYVFEDGVRIRQGRLGEEPTAIIRTNIPSGTARIVFGLGKARE